MSMYCYPLEVRVGFSASSYTATETDNTITLCVVLQEGSIANTTKLQLTISTQDILQSAQGRHTYTVVIINIEALLLTTFSNVRI